MSIFIDKMNKKELIERIHLLEEKERSSRIKTHFLGRFLYNIGLWDIARKVVNEERETGIFRIDIAEINKAIYKCPECEKGQCENCEN